MERPATYEKRRPILRFCLLLAAGIGINLLLSFAARAFNYTYFPLYLDNVGTILVTMIGGALPGVIVGFFTNIINTAFTSPITLYYGTISVLLALAARFLFLHGFFKKPLKILLCALLLALIGGVGGAALTYLVYGYGFGEEVSAPLANKIMQNWGFSPFAALLSADMFINLADKTLIVLISALVYRLLPAKIKGVPAEDATAKTPRAFIRSLAGKVVVIMVAFEIVLCVLVGSICYYMYRATIIDKYSAICRSAVEIAAGEIAPDKVPSYISERVAVCDYLSGETSAPSEYSADYQKVAKKLQSIAAAIPDLEYLYVYRIESDGCHVVFDIDEETNDKFVDFDESFEELIPTLLAGGDIDPIITDDTYGWLLTVYQPLKNDAGVCQAYVCADVSMNELRIDEMIFIVKVLTLLIGASVIVLVIVLRIAEKRLVEPINGISTAAAEFAFDSKEGQRSSIERIEQLHITSGDEIERLYSSLKKLAEDSTGYIDKIKTDAETITKMQEGIIVDFANMVESRDQCTGDHIKKTSDYVGRIAKELKKEGVYSDILTQDYIDRIVRSAPLHDVGKIKISDLLLNKPGRLTDEEFALMKTHTTEGAKILSEAMVNTTDSDYLKDAIDMAHYHHEWWNGRGYPDGLSGEEIPLSARIMAVADVFDALVSKRSYKEPFPFEKALAIISEESGTHFDPKVANAFLRIAEDIRPEQ